ncbi:MAG: ATP-binding protein [Actinomycetota bacterium]
MIQARALKEAPVAHPRSLSRRPARARQELRSLLVATGWPGEIDDVLLAVHEAIMNALQHAGGCTGATAFVDGRSVHVEVRDRGPGFAFEPYTTRAPDPLSERGRGLWLISRIATETDISRRNGETCLHLVFVP